MSHLLTRIFNRQRYLVFFKRKVNLDSSLALLLNQREGEVIESLKVNSKSELIHSIEELEQAKDFQHDVGQSLCLNPSSFKELYEQLFVANPRLAPFRYHEFLCFLEKQVLHITLTPKAQVMRTIFLSVQSLYRITCQIEDVFNHLVLYDHMKYLTQLRTVAHQWCEELLSTPALLTGWNHLVLSGLHVPDEKSFKTLSHLKNFQKLWRRLRDSYMANRKHLENVLLSQEQLSSLDLYFKTSGIQIVPQWSMGLCQREMFYALDKNMFQLLLGLEKDVDQILSSLYELIENFPSGLSYLGPEASRELSSLKVSTRKLHHHLYVPFLSPEVMKIDMTIQGLRSLEYIQGPSKPEETHIVR